MNLHERALDWLEKTANTGFPCYPLFEKDPGLNNLRATPGFVTFLSAQKEWRSARSG
jgi:hypothetical protein